MLGRLRRCTNTCLVISEQNWVFPYEGRALQKNLSGFLERFNGLLTGDAACMLTPHRLTRLLTLIVGDCILVIRGFHWGFSSRPGWAGPLGTAAGAVDCSTTSCVVARSFNSRALRMGGTYGKTRRLLLLMRAPNNPALSANTSRILDHILGL